MSKMRVALMSEIGRIQIVERDIPEPKDDEVLVKVKHCGICGSDIHYFEKGRIGSFIVTKPIVLGHECAGEVVEAGKKVTTLKKGDLVALEPGIPCGRCEFCKKGLYNLCPDVVFLATPPYDGAFCEYISYPSNMAFKLPKGMSTLEGALIEPLSVGFHAAMQAQATVGQCAVVLGSGCIGLCTLLALNSMGVNPVYVVDLISKRLDMAKKIGATQTINPQYEDVAAKIDELTNGKGADMVFETAGAAVTTQMTPALVKRGGTIVLVGMAPESEMTFDIGMLLSKEARINTVFRYRNIYQMAINTVSRGIMPLKDIVTSEFPFDKVEDAFKYNIENKAETVKVVIRM